MDGEAVAMKRSASKQVSIPTTTRHDEGDVNVVASSSGCNSYFSTIDIPERFQTDKLPKRRVKVAAEWKKPLRSYPLWNARPRRNSLERQCIFQFDEELDLPPLPLWQEAVDSDEEEGGNDNNEEDGDGNDSDETEFYKSPSSLSFDARRRRHSTPHFVTFLEKISRMYKEVYTTSEAGIVGSPQRSITRTRLKKAVCVNS